MQLQSEDRKGSADQRAGDRFDLPDAVIPEKTPDPKVLNRGIARARACYQRRKHDATVVSAVR